jgi:hypothetical protein
MGMFDCYVPVADLTCPCGRPLEGWQGKDAINLLMIWRQGELAPIGQDGDDRWHMEADDRARLRLPPRFAIYGKCAAGHSIDATGECTDGVWTRTTIYVRPDW